jgi:predicted RNase H-like nuclease (RuvC/YqgF family)
VCLAVAASAVSEERRDPVPVYTNEDLDRVRPFRGQTGVDSKPDFETAANERAGTPRQELGGDGVASRKGRHSAEGAEERWRYQAERFRAKLQPLRDKAADLREQIEERRRQPGVRPYTDPKIVAAERRLAVLERRIRDSESAFEDRARRQGALPGWIR